jgi:hypothetical protein
VVGDVTLIIQKKLRRRTFTRSLAIRIARFSDEWRGTAA